MVLSPISAIQLFVNRLTLRSVLTGDEENALQTLSGRVKEVRAHTEFVALGQQVDHSCLVIDGLVGRFGQNGDGERQITCLYIPGDMADLPSVVNPKSAWGLAALSQTTVLCVPHSDLRRMAASYPGIAEALWRDCVADGSIYSEWVVNVGRRDSIGRIAHVFCEMAVRCELTGQGDRQSFPLPITQSDLGDATGMTAIHVNRTLRELRERSIVTMHSGMVTVHDWKGLVSIGDFDDAFLLLEGPSPRIFEAT